MKTLSIDDILAAEDAVIEEVNTPSWGGRVFVRTISADKRDEFDQSFSSSGNGKLNLIGVRARLVGLCLCDEQGQFLKPTENQLLALGKKSSATIDRVFDVCQRINGMRAQDVEELEKNLKTAEETASG